MPPRFDRIVADWDLTITAADTMELLFKCVPPERLQYDHFLQIYLDHYNDYTTNVLPTKWYRDRNTVQKELLYQQSMQPVELSSYNECVRLGTFKGLTKKQMSAAYTEVKVRDGFDLFYRQNTLPFHVLSVNWTSLIIGKFINGPIHCNEFEFHDDICTGESAIGNVHTGYDKLQVLKTIPGRIVYIGDSSTDVLAMIHSDLGIIMGEGSASDQLRRMGYTVYRGRDIPADAKFVQVDSWLDVLYILN